MSAVGVDAFILRILFIIVTVMVARDFIVCLNLNLIGRPIPFRFLTYLMHWIKFPYRAFS